MEVLRARLAAADVAAVFVPEAATDRILSGVAPWTCSSMLEFQTRVMALQIEREEQAETAALKLEPAAVIVCDRGICDSRAYLSADEYNRALAANGLEQSAALARYAAIFHLESIAKSNPAAYTRNNNDARFEDAEEAALADDRVIEAWAAHPHVTFIASETDFADKAERLTQAILRHLGNR